MTVFPTKIPPSSVKAVASPGAGGGGGPPRVTSRGLHPTKIISCG